MGPSVLQAFSVNIAKIKELKARNPKPCGYMEVAPGNWVHVDCEQYKQSSRAITHLSPRKIKALGAKKTIYKPIKRMGRSTPSTATAAGGNPTGGPAQIGEGFPAKVYVQARGPVQAQPSSCRRSSLMPK